MTENQSNLVNAITKAFKTLIEWIKIVASEDFLGIGDIGDVITILGTILAVLAIIAGGSFLFKKR